MMQCIRRICLSLTMIPLLALAQTYGDWRVGSEDSGLPYMYTANESESYFGKWCDSDSDKCFWILAVRNKCEAADEFPALINSVSGVVAVTLICGGPKQIGGKTYHRLIIQEFDVMARLTSGGVGRLGIVFAQDDGAFRVNRFSLAGASAATARQDRAEVEYIRIKERRSTKDRLL